MTILLTNFTFWWILLNSVVFLGVCSIARFFFFFVGVFSSPYLVWSTWTPRGIWITGGIWYMYQSAPPPPARLLGASLLIPDPWGGAFHRESSMASWTTQFCPSWFGHSIFGTLFVLLPIKEPIGLPQALDINQKTWSSFLIDLFQLSYQTCILEVLWISHPSSIWRAAGADSVVSQCHQRRKDKVLFLAMMIHHQYYLMLLTCCVVFWKNCTLHVYEFSSSNSSSSSSRRYLRVIIVINIG